MDGERDNAQQRDEAHARVVALDDRRQKEQPVRDDRCEDWCGQCWPPCPGTGLE